MGGKALGESLYKILRLSLGAVFRIARFLAPTIERKANPTELDRYQLDTILRILNTNGFDCTPYSSNEQELLPAYDVLLRTTDVPTKKMHPIGSILPQIAGQSLLQQHDHVSLFFCIIGSRLLQKKPISNLPVIWCSCCGGALAVSAAG
jgi:hypothetical protein